VKIHIQARGFELTEGLRAHAERRLRFALSWADHDVRDVSIRLYDVNGPRGGNDKRCFIRIPLDSGHEVVVEDTEADLYVAIDRAAERTERVLARRLRRMREHRHGRPDFVTAAEGDDQATPATAALH